jgi:hypothetical protein
MTATDLFNAMVASGTSTRENIDTFFYLLSQDTLANQEAMTLTPDDFGIVYTTVDSKTIKVND